MKTLLNILWLLLAGVWMAIGYAVAGALMFVTIIGIPFGIQSFKLATYALWPFGRSLVKRPGRHAAVSLIGNLLWFVLGGWYLALGHLVTGLLLCVTVVGVPLGIASFKMAGAALRPFGREVVRGQPAAAGTAISVG